MATARRCGCPRRWPAPSACALWWCWSAGSTRSSSPASATWPPSSDRALSNVGWIGGPWPHDPPGVRAGVNHLEARVADEIRRRGPVPFAEVMELALYDPDDGFYA